jgi:hypothetical protein
MIEPMYNNSEPKIISSVGDGLYHVLKKLTDGPWKGKWDYAGESSIIPSSIEVIPDSEKILSTEISCKSELSAILGSKSKLYPQALEYAKTFDADYASFNTVEDSSRLPKPTEIIKGLWKVENKVILFRKKD